MKYIIDARVIQSDLLRVLKVKAKIEELSTALNAVWRRQAVEPVREHVSYSPKTALLLPKGEQKYEL